MATPRLTFPTLESGDRMTRHEFHRRYEQRPDIRAELIEGIVYVEGSAYVSSPTRFDDDERAALIRGWLTGYQATHPETRVGNNATMILDVDNEVQPDAFMFLRDDPASPRTNDAGYLEGAPQLVVEVAASSMSRDLGDKYRAYRRSGVQEYIVWRVEDVAIDWFRVEDGDYVRVEPDANGVVESAVFPGLRLDVPAMLELDAGRVLAALRGE